MSEIHGAVGSYVADALDPAELDDFQDHLTGCSSCRREVAEFGETLAELSTLASATPPPGLRGSVLSAIAEVQPLPVLSATEDEPEPRQALSVVTPDEHISDGNTPNQDSPAEDTLDRGARPLPAPTDELAARRARRLPRVFALVAAAALVIALGLGGWVVNLVQQQQSQSASDTLSSQILNAADVKTYQKTTAGGVPITFVVSKSLDKAMFVGPELGDPGAGKVYKLWTIDGHPVGDVSFSGDQSHRVFMTGDVASASGAALSVETNPDTTTPTETPAPTIVTF